MPNANGTIKMQHAEMGGKYNKSFIALIFVPDGVRNAPNARL